MRNPPHERELNPIGQLPALRSQRFTEPTMSHQPPKENKKKAQHTPKEKKAIKQQKKHVGDAAPFIKR
jgi:hypothetical protein